MCHAQTLTVREHEEGNLAVHFDCVWYTCRVIPFGFASLVVGARFSSSLSRVGQSMFQPEELGVQTYVDDPAWVSQGPPPRRRVLSVMLFLLWAAMGANLSWRKGKLWPVY